MGIIETKTEPMVINMGPHHPSMHGCFRMIVTLDGEDVVDCEPVIGYLHRGMEKIAENRTNICTFPTSADGIMAQVCLMKRLPSMRLRN